MHWGMHWTLMQAMKMNVKTLPWYIYYIIQSLNKILKIFGQLIMFSCFSFLSVSLMIVIYGLCCVLVVTESVNK